MRELLQHPYMPVIVFVVAAAIAILSLLTAMNSDRRGTGLLLAFLFAAVAIYFAPSAINLMEV
ncbi:hypothetical protein [Aurantiacibacter odishensis]|uniref:hypothetical protein n=1 Tax=Aurantiacibacter odishensis TaxID=1155476 RepID=UPI0013C41AB5|nr:hypothetical protein [Aurantiacibacter odishensis]